MYFFKKDNLTKFKSIMGNKIKGIVVKGRNSINIDEQEDLKVAEYYFKKKFN
jgi:CMP-N-acetylneuraminic acid synthetase